MKDFTVWVEIHTLYFCTDLHSYIMNPIVLTGKTLQSYTILKLGKASRNAQDGKF